jgi:hypothetical protein
MDVPTGWMTYVSAVPSSPRSESLPSSRRREGADDKEDVRRGGRDGDLDPLASRPIPTAVGGQPSLGVDPKTVRSTPRRRSRRGWRPAGRRGRRSDGRSWSGSGSRSWSTPSCGEVSWPEIARYHDVISSQLGAVTTVATIHRRLRDEQGLTASLASLRRYVWPNLAEEACRAAVTGPRG